MDGIGPGAMDWDHHLHLISHAHDFHSALTSLHFAETPEEILKYLPPVLQLGAAMAEWPPMADLGRLRGVHAKWLDVQPSAGNITGFRAARDDVYRAAIELYSAALAWAQVRDATIASNQAATLLATLETAATGSLSMLAAYAPTAEENATAALSEQEHNELHLQVASQQRRETEVPREELPAHAAGRIGHVVKALDPLREAVSTLESVHEPDEINLGVIAVLNAANHVGLGPASAPSDAMQSTIERWVGFTAPGDAAGLQSARHALVQLGWALVEAVEAEAVAARDAVEAGGDAATPQTDRALISLAIEAEEAYGRVIAP